MKIKCLREMTHEPIWLQDVYECMEAHLDGGDYPKQRVNNAIIWLRAVAQRCDIHESLSHKNVVAGVDECQYNAETKDWLRAELARICLVLDLTGIKPL